MSRARVPKRDKKKEFVRLKVQRLERESAGSGELEDSNELEASFRAGAPAALEPRAEDEQARDDAPDEDDDGAPPGPDAAGADDDRPARRSWVRSALLRSRPPVVVVRLENVAGHAEPVATLAPRTAASREMLDNLCDLLRDRFGPVGRAEFPDPDDWAKLVGDKPAGPAERLGLLARLAMTGAQEFARGGGHGRGSDIGLGHYAYKFAALPDGMPFSVGLLLAAGKSRAKKSGQAAGGVTFQKLPLGVRLMALAAALRQESKENWVRPDDLFRGLLRDNAVRLLGNDALTAISVDEVTDFREWLNDHGHPELFPNAPNRKRAAAGGGA